MEELKVLHGFPFSGKAFIEGVGYSFCDGAVVVDVEVAFIDSCICDSSDWVGEHMKAVG